MTFLKQICMNLKISTKFIHMTTRYNTMNFNQICINPLKLTYPYHNLHRKYCDHYFKEDYTDSDSEDVEYKRNIKNIILPNSDDVLTMKFSECNSLQDVFELLKHNNNQLNWKNISMAIAMVRELQIIYYRVCMHEKNMNYLNEIQADNFENILTNCDFLNLLSLIEKHYEFMNIQCLSYSILCLHKIGIDISYTINQKLSERLKKMLITTPIEELESCILSRFIVSIVSRRDLSSLNILKDIWPIILEKLSRYILFIYKIKILLLMYYYYYYYYCLL